MNENDRLLDYGGSLDTVGGWLALYVVFCFVGAVAFAWQLTVRPMALFFVVAAYACVNILAAVLILCKSRWALTVIAIQIGLRFIYLFFVALIDFSLHRMANPMVVVVSLCFGIALNTIWFLYFRMSRRVHNVFGRNL